MAIYGQAVYGQAAYLPGGVTDAHATPGLHGQGVLGSALFGLVLAPRPELEVAAGVRVRRRRSGAFAGGFGTRGSVEGRWS